MGVNWLRKEYNVKTIYYLIKYQWTIYTNDDVYSSLKQGPL